MIPATTGLLAMTASNLGDGGDKTRMKMVMTLLNAKIMIVSMVVIVCR